MGYLAYNNIASAIIMVLVRFIHLYYLGLKLWCQSDDHKCRHNVTAAVIRVGDGEDLEKLYHMYINAVSVLLTSFILVRSSFHRCNHSRVFEESWRGSK